MHMSGFEYLDYIATRHCTSPTIGRKQRFAELRLPTTPNNARIHPVTGVNDAFWLERTCRISLVFGLGHPDAGGVGDLPDGQTSLVTRRRIRIDFPHAMYFRQVWLVNRVSALSDLEQPII
ncbi:hypothetical protein ARC20_14160 [Stenotrophomonas panacihumi]|uniref:Uncharacterized protein n=1 Tax=Stenotrophomonas panacihumi TaxID=676599 RepID=A0A0R0AAJ5_9GAMM|nr:hypothetical protein ARC20_14160 [Stenotrophomonas panacihumi]